MAYRKGRNRNLLDDLTIDVVRAEWHMSGEDCTWKAVPCEQVAVLDLSRWVTDDPNVAPAQQASQVEGIQSAQVA